MAIKLTLLGVHLAMIVFLLAQARVRNPKSVLGAETLQRNRNTSKIIQYVRFGKNKIKLNRYFYNRFLITSTLWVAIILVGIFSISIVGEVVKFERPVQVQQNKQTQTLSIQIVDVISNKVVVSSELKSLYLVNKTGSLFGINRDSGERSFIYIGKDGSSSVMTIAGFVDLAGVFGLIFAIACATFWKISKDN